MALTENKVTLILVTLLILVDTLLYCFANTADDDN